MNDDEIIDTLEKYRDYNIDDYEYNYRIIRTSFK